jgi:outer membrane protein OmpA-like peptidoglycan-associated protein
MPIVCALFGYKEQTHIIDYDDPSQAPGATQNADGVWTIPYELELLEKKDVSVMYKVSFYKDAVIMLPESKSEMDQLVSLMKLNPNYEIKIHGHANGKNKRKIIALGDNNNFFNVAGSKTFEGTGKELSELRAQAVQLYLTLNGIDKGRSKVYGWGATIPLVSETSTSSKLNDRIEIEILGD